MTQVRIELNLVQVLRRFALPARQNDRFGCSILDSRPLKSPAEFCFFQALFRASPQQMLGENCHRLFEMFRHPLRTETIVNRGKKCLDQPVVRSINAEQLRSQAKKCCTGLVLQTKQSCLQSFVFCLISKC